VLRRDVPSEPDLHRLELLIPSQAGARELPARSALLTAAVRYVLKAGVAGVVDEDFAWPGSRFAPLQSSALGAGLRR
jgi:hypothetical protein